MSDHPTLPPKAEDTAAKQRSTPARPDNRPCRQPDATSPAPAAEEWVTIGRVVAVFGVHGELKVMPQTDIPNRFAHLRAVHIGPEHQRYRLSKSRPYRTDMLVITLAGVETANDAEALIGQALMMPLAELPALPPDQYYIHDLIGLRAETSDGRVLGTVVDILATGGNDVYVIREAKTGRDVMVPAVKEMVKRVDIAAGVIIIDPIPGLFDDRFEVAE